MNEYFKYEVKPKDSLFSIGQKYNTTAKAIYELNNLTSTTIYPGQILMIPKHSTKTIYTNNDTLETIIKKYNIKIEDIVEKNDIMKLPLKDNEPLVLPEVRKEYVVSENDTIDTLLHKLNISPMELLSANANEWFKVGNIVKF